MRINEHTPPLIVQSKIAPIFGGEGKKIKKVINIINGNFLGQFYAIKEKLRHKAGADNFFWGAKAGLALRLLVFAVGAACVKLCNSYIIYAVIVISSVGVIDALLFLSAAREMISSPESMQQEGYGRHESLSRVLICAVGGATAIWCLIGAIIGATGSAGAAGHLTSAGAVLLFFAVLFIIAGRVHARLAAFHGFGAYNSSASAWRGDAVFLVAAAACSAFQQIIIARCPAEIAGVTDPAIASLLALFYARNSLRQLNASVSSLLDLSLPESVRLEILSVVADNIGKMCEFRAFEIRRSGSAFIAELKVVLPRDTTLADAARLESKINHAVRERCANVAVRLCPVACREDCKPGRAEKCPFRFDSEKD